jgi:hypothetical protein
MRIIGLPFVVIAIFVILGTIVATAAKWGRF